LSQNGALLIETEVFMIATIEAPHF